MRVGRLRHRAELQQKVTVSDGGGGEAVQWTPVRTGWFYIRPLSVVQSLENMRRNTTTTHEITARYADDIGPDNRLVYQGRAFNIDGVRNTDERNREMVLLATEGVAT